MSKAPGAKQPAPGAPAQMTGEAGASDRDLEEELGGDVEAADEAFDVILIEFALAAENFGDDAESAEDIDEVLLEKAVLVH